MHYYDLAPCSYFGHELADRLVAVGWLDEPHPYPQGQVSELFIDKLVELLIKPWSPLYLMGYEECSFCDRCSYRMTYNAKTIGIGNLNLFVPGASFLYVMPSLAAHYVLEHNYT